MYSNGNITAVCGSAGATCLNGHESGALLCHYPSHYQYIFAFFLSRTPVFCLILRVYLKYEGAAIWNDPPTPTPTINAEFLQLQSDLFKLHSYLSKGRPSFS